MQFVKTILIIMTLVMTSYASPIVTQDSVPVAPDHPGIGMFVYARPLSIWTVFINDNPLNDIYDIPDFNDAWTFISFNALNEMIAIYGGGLSAWVTTLNIEGSNLSQVSPLVLGSFPINHQLAITASTDTGSGGVVYVYEIGSRSILVTEDTNVPEPATYALIGAGLVGLAFWKRKAVVKS